jgi:hypothetical protein
MKNPPEVFRNGIFEFLVQKTCKFGKVVEISKNPSVSDSFCDAVALEFEYLGFGTL